MLYSRHKFFFFKTKTSCEMRISDSSSDVCSSDFRQETRASKKAPRSRGLSVSIKRNRSLDVEETAQLLRAARVAQLSQRLGLYLADPLAGDVELLADFLEGVVGVHVDAEAHAQHLGLARGQAGEHVAHGFHQVGVGGGIDQN